MKENATEEKEREKMLDKLTKRLGVGPLTDVLKAARDWDARKVMVANALGQDTLLIIEWLKPLHFFNPSIHYGFESTRDAK